MGQHSKVELRNSTGDQTGKVRMDGWFNIGAFLARPSTSGERLVIVWLLILGCVGLGLVCIYLGLRAPAEQAAQAEQLRLYGYCLLGGGIAVWMLSRLVAWLLDR